MKKLIILPYLLGISLFISPTICSAYAIPDSGNRNLVGYEPNYTPRQITPYIDTTNLQYLNVSYGAGGAVTVTPDKCPLNYTLVGIEYNTDIMYFGMPVCQSWVTRCDGVCNQAMMPGVGGYCGGIYGSACYISVCLQVSYTFAASSSTQNAFSIQVVQPSTAVGRGGDVGLKATYSPVFGPPKQASRLVCAKVTAVWANSP